MTRKNRTPKEFLLTILNQHLKFLKRTKEKIPNKYHKDIETQEERTKNYYARVTKKEFVDYDTLRNEFEKEKRLNGVIRGKDKEIEMLRSDNNEKDKEIEMLRSDNNEKDILRSDNNEKDNQIEELETKMKYLHFDNFNLAKQSDSSISQLFWKFSRQQQPNQDHECPLQGSYLNHSVRELSVVSHLVFYLKKEVESTENEYLRVPENEKQKWLKKRTTIVREYYNNILKIKHPTIEDQYLLPQQQTSLQHQLTRQPSFVILDDFNFE
ncbi:13409_t:CDS:2 [Dentiscutata erythropus]|uniref:13409_t:CDS:1 n=1 Tax=Dentiscutata erythropus TaxID=1348616 RepID=A0A9N9AFT2_9GLOM|nr:13409_t:CDS:2 [Dentiscutata erythropus]